MANPAVCFALADHIATFTIDRPAARNAVNGQVARDMEAAIDQFESDPEAWVGILTGAGDTFCAGADLKEIAAGNSAALVTKRGGFAGFVTRERTKPVIAAVNGTAMAGGLELLLACDMAIVSSEAKIGLPEVKRSLVAAAGALYRLPRAVGPAKASEMVLTGDAISAGEALEIGLVNAVVPSHEVLGTAHALACRITANAPLAVQASRAVLIRSFGESDRELHKDSLRAFLAIADTEDFREGPLAFIEKRAPVWMGR